MANTHYPSSLKYTNTHLWLLLIEDDYAFVGLTSYAQKMIGKILMVNIIKNGLDLASNAEFGYVAGGGVGKIFELIMPFKGKVSRTNLEVLKGKNNINIFSGKTWIVYLKI